LQGDFRFHRRGSGINPGRGRLVFLLVQNSFLKEKFEYDRACPLIAGKRFSLSSSPDRARAQKPDSH